jgi:hypothetical protein
MSQFLDDHGVLHQSSCPHTPQYNCVVTQIPCTGRYLGMLYLHFRSRGSLLVLLHKCYSPTLRCHKVSADVTFLESISFLLILITLLHVFLGCPHLLLPLAITIHLPPLLPRNPYRCITIDSPLSLNLLFHIEIRFLVPTLFPLLYAKVSIRVLFILFLSSYCMHIYLHRIVFLPLMCLLWLFPSFLGSVICSRLELSYERRYVSTSS